MHEHMGKMPMLRYVTHAIYISSLLPYIAPMFSGIALAIATGLLWTVIAAIMSRAVQAKLNAIAFLALSGTIASAGCWIFILKWDVLQSGGVPRLADLIIIMVIAGILSGIGSVLMLLSMGAGHQAASWTISQSSMVIPFLWGTLVWKDPIKANGWIGMALIILSVVLLGLSKKHGEEGSINLRWLTLALSAFTILGVTQTMCSYPSQWPGWSDEARLRVPLYQTINTIPQIVLVFTHRARIEKSSIPLAVLLAAGLALTAVIGQLTIFSSLDFLGEVNLVSITYPLAVGVCVLGFALYSGFVLRERFTHPTRLGLLAGVIGLLLLSIKDLMN